MLALADTLLTALHVAVILGFVFLWIPRKTVRLHRLLVVLTALSWLVLGLWKGLGYCVLTDLAWRIKRARGVRHLPSSFIQYLVDGVTGTHVPHAVVDSVTAAVFVAGVAAAAVRYRSEKRAG